MTFSDDPLVLRALATGDERAFRTAVAEWPRSEEMELAPKFVATEPFSAYVRRLEAFANGIELPDGWVPSETMFGFVGDAIVGRLQLRLRFNDFLWRVGGQIGYVVLPRFRRRGYARSMLRQGLQRARSKGMRRILITCDATNVASRQLIETSGGMRIGGGHSEPPPGQKLRYWLSCER
ncbi:MAG TPA: GNAT family N-acetyltransferase [Thermoanaerobaculia bacterium]|nr:GNAT family N-acetyltransferase [Thermoanaerobaculia bacterium]